MDRRTVNAYIRPDFADAQAEKKAQQLDAILQALINCHRTLQTINLGDVGQAALEDVASAYNTLASERGRMQKATAPGRLAGPESAGLIDVEFEDGFTE